MTLSMIYCKYDSYDKNKEIIIIISLREAEWRREHWDLFKHVSSDTKGDHDLFTGWRFIEFLVSLSNYYFTAIITLVTYRFCYILIGLSLEIINVDEVAKPSTNHNL